MKCLTWVRICAALAGPLVAPAGAGPGPAGETGFLELWRLQQTDPAAYLAHMNAWCDYAGRAVGGDPLRPVAITLAAWHALRAGRYADAEDLLLRYIEAEPVGDTVRGARELARAWLTCLDRERIVKALEAYRIRHVRYPARLEDLVSQATPASAERLPLRDRWGHAWVYRLEPLRSMPSLYAQRYVLQSRVLEAESDLRVALALPYGERIRLHPVRVRRIENRPPVVTLAGEELSSGPVLIQAGASRDGVTVAHASQALIVLYDRFHWRVFAAP